MRFSVGRSLLFDHVRALFQASATYEKNRSNTSLMLLDSSLSEFCSWMYGAAQNTCSDGYGYSMVTTGRELLCYTRTTQAAPT